MLSQLGTEIQSLIVKISDKKVVKSLVTNGSRLIAAMTKVLTHFCKTSPFCIVDILIPFPCLPQPLPPKINVVFWTLKSFFYFRHTTLIRGVRGFTVFSRNEIINELKLMFVKSTNFKQKCQLLLSLIVGVLDLPFVLGYADSTSLKFRVSTYS